MKTTDQGQDLIDNPEQLVISGLCVSAIMRAYKGLSRTLRPGIEIIEETEGMDAHNTERLIIKTIIDGLRQACDTVEKDRLSSIGA